MLSATARLLLIAAAVCGFALTAPCASAEDLLRTTYLADPSPDSVILPTDATSTSRFDDGLSLYWSGDDRPEEMRQRTLNVDLNAWRSGALKVDLHSAAFEARLPVSSAEGGLDIGSVTGWEENRIGDLGLRLGLFGDRIRYSADYSWSSYSPGSSRALVDEDATDSQSSERGDAQSQRIDVTIWQGDPVAVSTSVLNTRVASSYRSLRESGGSFTEADVEIWEAGATLSSGLIELSLSEGVKTALSDPAVREYYGNSEIALSLFGLHDRLSGAHGAVFWGWLPSTISLTTSRSRYASDSQAESDDVERSFGLGLNWDRGNATTSLNFSRSRYDNRQQGFEHDDKESWSLEGSHTVSSENWDLSAKLSVTQSDYGEADNRWRDTSHSGSVSFSLRSRRLPDLSVSPYVTRESSRSSEYGYASRSRTVGLTTTLDFLKYLGRTHYGSEPQLELTYDAEWTRAQDLDTGSSKDLNQSLVLSTEIEF